MPTTTAAGFLACCARLRDLLTERRAGQRPGRFWPDATGEAAEDEDMATGAYYIIIHCAQCGTPIEARRQGSKKKAVTRVCAACRKALRLRAA